MAKSRVFHIVSKVKNPDTGEVYLDETKIKDGLAHRTIKRWGYALHDKDNYTILDEQENPEHVAGTHKDDHWHIVIEMGSNQTEVDTIAKWFGIPAQFIDIAKGHGAFLDVAEYLTHENPNECGPIEEGGKGKHRYDDEEVVASFDFRRELDARAENKLKYGKDLNKRDQQRYEVLYNGKSLLQCQADDRVLYMDDYRELKKLRMEYLQQLPPPPVRINFYVQGRGGIGKGLMCRALARSLCPDLTDDSEIFFEVGAPGAAFEGYDGQPVIIWNDRRHSTLLKELKGRENVFNVFDTHPTRQKQNIKFGSVALINKINIVNSVEPYDEFLDGFVARHKNDEGKWEQEEDKGQSYRRFPFIMPLREEDFDLMLNKGFMYGTSDFEEYEVYGNIRGNMQKLAERCGQNEKLLRELNAQVLLPVVEKYDEVQKQFEQTEMTEEDEDKIRAEFAGYGKRVPILPEEYVIYKGKIYPVCASVMSPITPEPDADGFISIAEALEGIKPICDAADVFVDYTDDENNNDVLPFG